ncbi:hypothetical protein [Andreprevotia sp. IGB-42]|uniref:hypothetical protein n=1 Tax=Andreprevotia sp. IGB-42 TaxID=2497473 RepID=UPI00135C7912|nr:hypothetical protein [Andreprevotia sp. IGB-42]
MAKRDLSKPQSQITFQCRGCGQTFKAEPSQVMDAPDRPHHPYEYMSHCVCGAECLQAPHERALMKAWANATGPRTAEGKAATAANLDGHPTPEEARRTRFNAMKHGIHAKTATYFPAKPDGYSFCSSCTIDRYYCSEQPACEKQTVLFMQTHAAFEQRDPSQLTGIFSGMQAATLAIIQQTLQTILADGVTLRHPAWYHDKEGGFHLAQYLDPQTGDQVLIQEVKSHPLLKVLAELLSRNNLSLADLAMTPKVHEREEQQLGRLKDVGNQGAISEFITKQADALGTLADKIAQASQRRDSDPILIEYQQQNGGNDG